MRRKDRTAIDGISHEPYLLTPGPLTTTRATKEAMLRDWGSRNGDFIAMNARVRRRLAELVHGDGSHVCVPLQGSGTFIVEAMIARWCRRPASCWSW